MTDSLDRGTDVSLVAVYLEKRADLRRFFAARLGSVEAAEDLVQEIYLKLAATDDAQAEVLNPSAYLYRLGSNLMLDRIKQQRRAVARDDGWHAANRMAVGGVDVSREAAADDAVAARERLRQLVAALEELAPDHRRAFRLHKFDGLSHAEVAQIMGVSRSAIEKWISAALKHLHARLP